MKIKQIKIDEFPPELGPPGRRLIVLAEKGSHEDLLIDMLIDGPITTFDLAVMLEQFAKRLKTLSQQAGG